MEHLFWKLFEVLIITVYKRHLKYTGFLPISTDCNEKIDIFTALHVMQTRYSEENSVCLSVCPSVRLSVRPSSVRLSHAWIVTKTVERFVQIYIPYERTFSLVF